jgi:hypothetical protein
MFRRISCPHLTPALKAAIIRMVHQMERELEQLLAATHNLRQKRHLSQQAMTLLIARIRAILPERERN